MSGEAAVIHEAPKPTWTSRRLIEALKGLGYRVRYLLVHYVTGSVGSGQCSVTYRGRCLALDAALLRSLGRFPTAELLLKRVVVLSQLAETIPVVNHPQSMLTARDKYGSLLILARAGLPVPRTVVTEDPYEALRLVESWGAAVIKPVSGTMGLGSFLVTDTDTAYRVLSLIAALRQPIYVQEYVEKKGNQDIRVFVVGDEVVAAAYRVARPGSWKTNVAQGAVTKPAKVDRELEELAIKATRALGLCYAGVDVAERADGGYVIFEVNASPLWQGLYRATGVDPAAHIARLVDDLVKGRREPCRPVTAYVT